MTHFGLSIDPATNDLHLDASNNLATVTGAHAVGQHVRQRLKTFEGEWFLDTTAGVAWIGQLLGQNYDPALAEAVVKAEILDTDGVVEIEGFSVGYNRGKRELKIQDIAVRTIYDETVQI